MWITTILMLSLMTGCKSKDASIHSQGENLQDDRPQTDQTSEYENDVQNETEVGQGEENKEDLEMGEIVETNEERLSRLEESFKGITYSETLKRAYNNNPVMTQRLGADPYAIEYDGRVYLYMTGDVVEYDGAGAILNNSFAKINKLNVVSSADLVNWTDHGTIYAAGPQGAASWGNNSWAPAVAHKQIDGKDQFFIYFANGGNGIGVLRSDHPTGPFVDPLGCALISRSTPNCGNVAWLFDPAVLVDDDGRAYLYFGGGIPDGNFAQPGTGRVVELNPDMISLACDPIALDIPYLFEDSGINKIGDTYYYSYCSNWNVPAEATAELGFKSAQIVYMTSKNPMGPFTLQRPILQNPGDFFGCYGTNHHCMFRFQGEHYMAYHTQILESRMDIKGGYRSTNINHVTINEDGSIASIRADEAGVEQIGSFDPYQKFSAVTMATMAGITTVQSGEESERYGSGHMIVSEIDTGDWIALKGVEFGTEGATKITTTVKLPKESTGVVQIRLDNLFGDVVGYVELPVGTNDDFVEITEELVSSITGKRDLYFVFSGNGYEVDAWKFE